MYVGFDSLVAWQKRFAAWSSVRISSSVPIRLMLSATMLRPSQATGQQSSTSTFDTQHNTNNIKYHIKKLKMTNITINKWNIQLKDNEQILYIYETTKCEASHPNFKQSSLQQLTNISDHSIYTHIYIQLQTTNNLDQAQFKHAFNALIPGGILHIQVNK
jgi:hypothetical protein